jgi:hypothetical protein
MATIDEFVLKNIGLISQITYLVTIYTCRPYNSILMVSLVATSADSVPSSYLVRITIAPIGITFGNLQ